jgi:tetratricopeptide (TPR) repeat protein
MNDAVARYQKLLEQYPDNELARFSLGKAYFDLGQLGAAKEQFELALSRKPDWMVVQILAGKCELALGNRSAARAAFERARELATKQEHEGPLEEMNEILKEMTADGITSS